MKGTIVRGLPISLSVALFAWTGADIATRTDARSWPLWGFFLAVAAIAAVQGSRSKSLFWERSSRATLAVAFFGERLFLSGPETVLMMGFLVLLIAQASLQRLERTFSPVYRAARDSGLIRKVDSAVSRAYVRLLGLLGLTFAASYILALLVPLIGMHSGNLFVAFGLAILLLLIVASLALPPAVLKGRET